MRWAKQQQKLYQTMTLELRMVLKSLHHIITTNPDYASSILKNHWVISYIAGMSDQDDAMLYHSFLHQQLPSNVAKIHWV